MEFLKSKGRMSDLDQSRMFVQGFQPELWATIKNRLAIKFPDHYPDDPYPLSNIYEAAKFVLHGSTPSILLSQPAYGTQPPSHIQPTTSPTIKVKDLSFFLEKFSQTLIKALVPQQQPRGNSNSSSNQNSSSHLHAHTHAHENATPPNHCYFCGELGHYRYNCPICAQYLTDGKIRRNQEGKVVLPSGGFVLRSIPGITLCDRVYEYHKQNPNQTATGVLSSNANPQSNQLMYSIGPTPSSIPSPVISQNINAQISDNISEQAKTKQYIKSLERELFNLHHKQTFDGVKILYQPTAQCSSQPAPSNNSSTNPTSSNPPPKNIPTSQPPSSTPAQPTVENTQDKNTPVTNPPIHPFANTKETVYCPPQDKNFASQPKPPKEKDFTYKTTLQSKIQKLWTRFILAQ
jgi:hypothetical protein